ncbi:hypothetical protein [Steroidobacter denitrificans]|nr:hypothetical protein [Steroidobacter denitrificans]
MNRSAADPVKPSKEYSHRSGRLRFEVTYAAVLLAFGVFVLPALIYGVGVTLLGPYGAEGGEAGWGRFYGDFFANLAGPSIQAWAIATGPLLLITMIRGMFLGMNRGKAADSEPDDAGRPTGTRPRRRTGRIEPRIDAD